MNIDREIAEKVMGYCERPIHGIGWWHQAEENRWSVAQYSWHPSTDIKQAFEVRDKIKEQIFSVRMKFKGALQQIISDRLDRDYFVMIHPEEEILLVTAEDICLAALKAVEA